MNYENNVYYSPEKWGMSIFDQIDTAGAWEFDMFVIWEKDDDNTLWYATDSGCSCPTPFENIESMKDLDQITTDTLYNFEQALKNHTNISTEDYKKMYNSVKLHLKSKN